ncbi:hypothetical protein [Methylobacterium oxalidis]|uniref:hypothetical protein n=1 Tax=Methylobacterium oxalidis TaxID=944322 RepID=UPI001478D04C|nr:hypothetical protein [Methylobacterium oxalidis]
METVKNDQSTNPESGIVEEELERKVIPLPLNRRVVLDQAPDHDDDDDPGPTAA